MWGYLTETEGGNKFDGYHIINRRVIQIGRKEGVPTLFKSSCFTIVYKNFDISGLFGMVGPLLRLARAAMVRS